MPRVHIYLNAEELEELEELADERQATRSFLIRVAVRRLLGLRVPPEWSPAVWHDDELPRLHDATVR